MTFNFFSGVNRLILTEYSHDFYGPIIEHLRKGNWFSTHATSR